MIAVVSDDFNLRLSKPLSTTHIAPGYCGATASAMPLITLQRCRKVSQS